MPNRAEPGGVSAEPPETGTAEGSGRAPSLAAAIALALGLTGLHAWSVWGYTGLFWGDHGRWLHEVERFALGELPYRDFQWHFPPAGLWLVGSFAKLVGTSLAAVSGITVAISLALAACFAALVRRTAPDQAWVAIPAALVPAFAYAQRGGVPLPLGLYTPAALVAFTFLLAALVVTLRLRDGASAGSAALAGFLEAGCILSKQDVWLPAALLLAFGVREAWRRRAVAAALAQLGVATATVFAGAIAIATTSADGTLLRLIGGFGHFDELGGRGLPSWERLTVEIAAASWVCAAWALGMRWVGGMPRALRAALALSATGALAVALHLAMSVAISRELVPAQFPTPTQSQMRALARPGEPALRTALRWLERRLREDPVPLILPVGLALAVAAQRSPWQRQRELALLLTSVWAAARLRRGFESTEWFDFVLGIPAGLVVLELFCDGVGRRRRQRLFALGLAAVLAYGVGALRAEGRGRGTAHVFPEFRTRRGLAHWPAGAVDSYRRLDAALTARDPTRARPLFAFGYTGGFDYFLDRRNPAPATQDFFFSNFDPQEVAARVAAARPPVFLLDNPFCEQGFPARHVAWGHWEPTPRASVYETFDRPRFEALRAPCVRVGAPASKPTFTLYDCPAR